MKKQRVAIDSVPIRSGAGGTGSGIWSYAKKLIENLDSAVPDEIELIVFATKGQLDFLTLKNIKVQEVSFPNGVLFRVVWVQLILPMLCFFKKIDVIHKLATETPFFSPSKRVTTVHDFYYEYLTERSPQKNIRFYEKLENLYFSFVTKTCFKKSASIISVSKSTAAEAEKRWPSSKNKLLVIWHGSPNILENSSVKSSEKSAQFRFLCVAKFMEHKGQIELLRGFEKLIEKRPELKGKVSLTLRGFVNDEEYFNELLSLIEKSDVRNSVEILSYQEKVTDLDIYGNSDAVILLSRYEGFGLPVLEAQAAGLPMLCSDLPVLSEVGGDGILLVDMNDSAKVAEKMASLIDSSELCDSLVKKGFENLKRFSWQIAAEKTLKTYMGVDR